MTRAEFVALAGGQAAAVEFEEQALAIGREFLPACAIAVLDSTAAEAEPESAYWVWLTGQLCPEDGDGRGYSEDGRDDGDGDGAGGNG